MHVSVVGIPFDNDSALAFSDLRTFEAKETLVLSYRSTNTKCIIISLNVLQLKSNFQIIGLTFICMDSTPC